MAAGKAFKGDPTTFDTNFVFEKMFGSNEATTIPTPDHFKTVSFVRLAVFVGFYRIFFVRSFLSGDMYAFLR